jgi:hypothetical protein
MEAEQGIYVYGIGRASDSAAIVIGGHPEIYQIDAGELVAYARIVALSDYSEEALKKRADDQAWLIAEAQQHHAVIAEVHQQTPMLPAKFGSAYATEDDVRNALEQSKQTILERLRTLEGCDEWAAYVYLEEGDLSQVVLARDSELKDLAAEFEGASEGRKYMLRQRLQSRMKDAIERYETEISQQALNALRPLTADFQFEPPRDAEATPEGEIEIARASMLVRRDQAEQFISQAEQTNQSIGKIWLKITGPWPAYSFAQFETEEESIRYG